MNFGEGPAELDAVKREIGRRSSGSSCYESKSADGNGSAQDPLPLLNQTCGVSSSRSYKPQTTLVLSLAVSGLSVSLSSHEDGFLEGYM